MTPPAPLAIRLLLEAQEAFLRAVDHVPAPGRGGPLGRLNAPGWVTAHLASSHDLWINVLIAGRARDPWAEDWDRSQRAAATLAHPLATSLEEARGAFVRIADRATEVVEAIDAVDLRREVDTPRGTVTAGYLIARAPAHLFSHAGELAVIGALVTAPDPDLPGALPRLDSPEPSEEAEANPDLPPLVVRLLLDAQHEFARAVEALPFPAATGAIGRVHPGSLTIAEVANHESDRWGREPRIWSGSAVVGRVSNGHIPRFEESRAAFRAAVEGSAPVLEALRAADLVRPYGETTVGAEVGRSAALLFERAGELNALASLFGAPDLAQPGALARTGER